MTIDGNAGKEAVVAAKKSEWTVNTMSASGNDSNIKTRYHAAHADN